MVELVDASTDRFGTRRSRVLLGQHSQLHALLSPHRCDAGTSRDRFRVARTLSARQ